MFVALIAAGNHKAEIEALLSRVDHVGLVLIFTFMGTAFLAAVGKLIC